MSVGRRICLVGPLALALAGCTTAHPTMARDAAVDPQVDGLAEPEAPDESGSGVPDAGGDADGSGDAGGSGDADGSGDAGGSGGTGGGGGAMDAAGEAGVGALSFVPTELVSSVSLSVTLAGVSKVVKLHNGTAGAASITALDIVGTDAAMFVLEGAPALPASLAAAGDLALMVRFRPSAAVAATTVYAAALSASASTVPSPARAGLFGLAMNVANTEPSLDQVVRTLGYAIDVGSKTTSLGTGAGRLGDEIAATRFAKAHAGVVAVQPVARYSPFETAPYGTYTYTGAGTALMLTRTPLGAMSKGAADNLANRTLFPPLDAGAVTTFDPGAATFGLYAESAANTASLGADGRLYQEDALNDDQAGVLPVHRVRVYPMKNRAGQTVADTYLVACEEANNSDYQDYVLVVSNVVPRAN
jgi:hypothetical protein